MTIAEIINLRNLRNTILEKDPVGADRLEAEIHEALKNKFNEYPCDFIIETVTHFGWCPQVLYDDDGRFAVTNAGMSPVPIDGPVEGTFHIFARKHQWAPTIREALWIYLARNEEEPEN